MHLFIKRIKLQIITKLAIKKQNIRFYLPTRVRCNNYLLQYTVKSINSGYSRLLKFRPLFGGDS